MKTEQPNGTFGVAIKAVIYKDGKYLLLFKSSKEDIAPESFDFPGGRLKFGEQPEETLIREVREETGLEIKPIGVFSCWTLIKDRFQLVGIDFFCQLNTGEERLSREHITFLWQSPEQIYSHPKVESWMKEAIAKAELFRKQQSLPV